MSNSSHQPKMIRQLADGYSMRPLKNKLYTHETQSQKSVAFGNSKSKLLERTSEIGIISENNSVTFVAFAHRKDIYKRFP